MPLPIVAGVISVLGAGFAKTLSIESVKFIATRAMLYTLFTLILPVILYNVFTRILQEMMDLASSEIQATGLQATVIQLTGMGGWIGEHLRIPECFALVMSAVGLAFTLRMLGR